MSIEFIQIEIAYVNNGFESIRSECIIPRSEYTRKPPEFSFFFMLYKSPQVAQFTVSNNGNILMPKNFSYGANEKWVNKITYVGDYYHHHPEEFE